MRGVTLLTVGRESYSRWAINMALSLRFHSPKVKLQCITSKQLEPRITASQLFDVVTVIEDDAFTHNGQLSPAKIKTSLYKYLHFETTIYLDCDGALFKDITPLFDLKAEFATDVQGCCAPEEMEFNAMKWAKPEVVREHFGLQGKVFCAINSSFMLIRKGKVCEELFDTANDLLLNNPLPPKSFWHKWGRGVGHQPDELYFNVAMAKCGIQPEHYPAIYFRMRSQGSCEPLSKISQVHYGIGLFGNETTNHFTALNLYDSVMRPAINHFRFPNVKASELIKHKFANTKSNG